MICYVFLEFRSEPVNESEITLDLKMNPIILYSTYINDYLFLRALSFFPRLADDGSGLQVKENTIYVIPPIHKAYPTEDVFALYKMAIKPEVFCYHASIFKMDNTPFTAVNLVETAEYSDFEIVETITGSRKSNSLKIGERIIRKIGYLVAKTYQENNDCF